MDGQAGVVTAFVRGVDLSEGTVELEYRWLPEGSTLPPPKAPIASPMSGGGRGFLFMPEDGDEVLVAFERGEWSHPRVVGCLWNGEQTPPESDRNNRVILTPGGHTLRFEDGDPKKVILRSNGGHEVAIDDDAGTMTLKVGDAAAASTIKLDSQSITMTGGGRKISMSGGQVAIS